MPLKRILRGIYGSSLSRVYYIGNFTFTFKQARTVHQQLIESICAQDVWMAESIVDEHLNRAVAEAYELLDEQQA